MFSLWYAWRGLPGAPSIVELIELAEREGSPGWIKDFSLILRELGRTARTQGFFTAFGR